MNPKTTKILGSVGIGIVLIGGALMYWQQRDSRDNNHPQGSDAGFEFGASDLNESLPVDSGDIFDESEETAIPSEGPEFEAALTRDKQRLQDVQNIADALKDFVNDTGNYPSEMVELVPDYLDTLPSNPTPGGFEYSYTPIGSEPATYYSLYYHLEVGVDEISSGDHEATPDGIATL